MSQNQTEEENATIMREDELKNLEQCLPKVPNKIMGNNNAELVNYQNFWFSTSYLKNILWFQKSFQAHNTDLIIASPPKCGTTWLKTLVFSVVNRGKNPINQNPLFSNRPHDLVYRLENGIYKDNPNNIRLSSLHKMPSPRLFNTHLPYSTLSESVKASDCRILYISRNPLDTIVSEWHFYTNIGKNSSFEDHECYSIHDYFEDFIQGKTMYGPFFQHVVEYWKQSLQQPDKVLFLKYEDLKENPIFQLKRVAQFVGLPFSSEEESQGVIRDIIELCSISNLKGLEVNQKGGYNTALGTIQSQEFFRKGIVGDWSNYFTPSMVERMCNLMQEKFEATGLTFKLSLDP